MLTPASNTILHSINNTPNNTTEPVKRGKVVVITAQRPTCPIAQHLELECTPTHTVKRVQNGRITSHYKSKRPSTSVDVKCADTVSKGTVQRDVRVAKSYSDLSRHRKPLSTWLHHTSYHDDTHTRCTSYNSCEIQHINGCGSIEYLTQSMSTQQFYSIVD